MVPRVVAAGAVEEASASMSASKEVGAMEEEEAVAVEWVAAMRVEGKARYLLGGDHRLSLTEPDGGAEAFLRWGC